MKLQKKTTQCCNRFDIKNIYREVHVKLTNNIIFIFIYNIYK